MEASEITEIINAINQSGGLPVQMHMVSEQNWEQFGITVFLAAIGSIYPPSPFLDNDAAYPPMGLLYVAGDLIRLSPPEETIIPIKRASFDKIREELGWEAGTDLKTGLERTYEALVGQKRKGEA